MRRARAHLGFIAFPLAATLWGAAIARAESPPQRPQVQSTTPGDHPFSNPLNHIREDGTAQPPALDGLDVHEHLGEQLPLDLTFKDSSGKTTTLRDTLHAGRPAILTLVYFDCPMLCSLVMTGLVQGLKKLDGWTLGKNFDAVTVSFNPADSMEEGAEKRRGYLQDLGASDLGTAWPFLTGDAASTKTLAQAVGFDYRYDEQAKTFAHNAVIFVLTPEGKISRYLYGVTFEPLQLRLALTEAGQGKSGSSFERFLLSCYHYDPAMRRYGSFIFGFMKAGGLLVLLALSALIGRLFWREHHPLPRPREAGRHRGGPKDDTVADHP
jgi:protein SCO1/2